MTQVFSRPSFAALPATDDRGPVPRFMPGTRIATPGGPRPVETLASGDDVVARDGTRGIARVSLHSVPREDWTYRRAIWPVRVPVGSLGNAVPLRLAPTQRVWLASPALARTLGVPGVWARVDMLIGLCGLVSERPLGALRQYGIGLDGEAEGALQAEGVWCALDDPDGEADRDRLRAAFIAMNAAGEPKLT